MAKKNKQKKPLFLYFVICVLTAALVGLGALTVSCMENLANLQEHVTALQKTVQDISDSSAVLIQKSKELGDLEAFNELINQIGQQGNHSEPAPEVSPESGSAISDGTISNGPEEEGMLSPSQGSIFSANSDQELDNLLAQIEPLLPQNNGIWSVYVSDLSKGSEGMIGGQSMQAASLIKLFIMGAVYENYDQLSSQYGVDTLNGLLNSMITVSDNEAANTLTSYLGNGDSAAGMNAVNAFCLAHDYTGTSMGRLLLQSNEFGDNYTSVRDCGRFLKEIYQIVHGTAVNPTLSHADAMYELLKQQQRTHKIPAQLPDGVHVANKTGELSNVENDAGIIYDTAKGIDLVVCFMSEGLSEVGSAQASIAQNSRLIYGYYNE